MDGDTVGLLYGTKGVDDRMDDETLILLVGRAELHRVMVVLLGYKFKHYPEDRSVLEVYLC